MDSKDYTPLVITDYIHETFRVKHDADPDGFAHGIGAINVANHVRDIYEARYRQDAATIAALIAEVEALRKVGNDMHSELRANDAGNGSSDHERNRMYKAWDALCPEPNVD